jgi:hypothetical protein
MLLAPHTEAASRSFAPRRRAHSFDVVWWSNAGLHYMHTGERLDKCATCLSGVVGASITSYNDPSRAHTHTLLSSLSHTARLRDHTLTQLLSSA